MGLHNEMNKMEMKIEKVENKLDNMQLLLMLEINNSSDKRISALETISNYPPKK